MWPAVALLLVLVFPSDVMLGGERGGRYGDNSEETTGHDDSEKTGSKITTAATKRTRATVTHAMPAATTTSKSNPGTGAAVPGNGKPEQIWPTTTNTTTHGAAAHAQSDVPVRICDDGWSKLSVLSSMHCLKGVPEGKSWGDAMQHCHDRHAQLLTLDMSVFDGSVKDASDVYVVRRGIEHGIQKETVWEGEMWTSLHITNGKLWWESDVPLVLAKRTMSLWEWGLRQPAGRTGDCGAAASNPNMQTTLRLVDCNIKLPFVCINAGLDVSLNQDSRCPRRWQGNVDLGQCYWSSGNKKTFSDAQQDCNDKGAALATPTTGPLHNLTMAANKKNAQFWIGMTVNSRDEYYWVNGQLVTSVRASTNSREHSEVNQCVYVDPDRSPGHEWVGTVCDKKLSYVCQIPSARSDVKILQNPSDLSITTMPKQKGLNQPAMRCDAADYDSRKSVVWVHDGKYIDNGPPPGGLTLYLSSLAGPSESPALPIVLQGYYHCEVWGQDPAKKVASSKAYLRFKDVLTLRGTLRLPGGHYNPDYIIHDLNPDSPRTNFTDFLTALGTVHFGRFTYKPVTRIQRFSPGSLIISFHWIYSTTGNRGPKRLSDKQYERLVERLFSKVKDDIYIRLLGPNFNPKYTVLLSGIQRSDISLRRIDVCSARTTLDANQRRLDWPNTAMGKEASSDQVCLTDGRPLGKCTCVGNYTLGAFWGPVDLARGCQEPEGSSLTRRLRRLAQTRTNSSNAGRVSESASRLTDVADQITYPDIAYTSRIMQNMAGIRGVNHAVGRDMVKIANNILKAKRSEIVQAQRVDKSSNRIVHALETYGRMADLGDKKWQIIVESDVALEVWDVSDNDPVVGFGSLTSKNVGFANQSLVSFVQTADMLPNMMQAAIMLSRSTVDMAIEIDSLLREDNATTRLIFAVFNNPSFFLSPGELNGAYKINSKVISATFNGIQLENLSEPVVTVFQPLENVTAGFKSSDCVYWDFDALDGQGDWSTNGCWYNGSQDGRVICLCDHMTNFAILADVEATSLPENHAIALNIITIIGVSLSMLGLVFTILSFIIFKSLRRPRGQKVLFNLALALLAVYIVFLAGIRATSNRNVCIIVAALLQYFLLASFAWMLVEASLLYMRFVKVFNTYIEKFILKVAIPAWGVPALIVGIVAAVDYNLFRGPDDYCWLDRPAFYYGFALPVGIVIVLNAIIFVFIIKGITCDRGSGLQSTQTRSELNWLQLQAAVASFVILGLTWVVGFFAVRDTRITLQYVFCILNSTQGLLIFLFHNIREKSVRTAWRSLCCRDESSKMTFTNPVTSIVSTSKRVSSKRRSRNHSVVYPNDVTRTYSNPDERKNTL